eukprot:TRINITY_DN66423_c0_g1_i1.p1 TRINITY_DN66423_c0_g1~~TRINITY_DN66423_c0_g1_i1.p1  ORF type:complete len:518 (-),score=31.33 TRINITY_DN66423_c0_g1_i1:218-1771(-)
MMAFGVKCAIASLCAFAWATLSDAEYTTRKEVLSIPGLHGKMTSRMYSGYLLADALHGRRLFYIYVESQGDPQRDPFVFWSNGGPGCSGMEGFWKEHGPYSVRNRESGVFPNPLAWNQHANVLYIDHPVGVGFSYSDDASDYRSNNDDRSSSDLYNALQDFLGHFPELHGRDLYLTGESYAGEYIPHLAHTIAFGSHAGLRNAMKGIMLGNPVMWCEAVHNGKAQTQQLGMYFYHGLLPYKGPYKEWHDHRCDESVAAQAVKCQSIFDQAVKMVGSANQQIHRQSRALAMNLLAVPGTPKPQAAAQVELTSTQTEPAFDSDHKYQSFCTDNHTLSFADLPFWKSPLCHPLGDPGRLHDFLNRRDVQDALHIQHAPLGGEWIDCTSDPRWNYNISNVNILKTYYEPLFAALPPSKFSVLIFSGDEDIATVPHATTQRCLAELPPMNQTQAWTPYRHNGIVIGYWEAYERYTFATVKGAGHTVAQYQPLAGYQLFSRWLTRKNLTEEVKPDLSKVILYM